MGIINKGKRNREGERHDVFYVYILLNSMGT